MTEAREISAERLAYIIARDVGGRKKNKECGCKPVDWQTEIADLLSHIAFQKAALEAANTRAEEAEGMLKDADEHVARLTTEKVQQFARATAAEAENARLREALQAARSVMENAREEISTAFPRSHLDIINELDATLYVADEALAPAPAIAPPPAPAPEPSEARDIARRKGIRKDVRKFVQNVQNSLGGGTPEARRQYEDRAVDVLTHLLDRALDAHRDGGGR